jgi:hypothetical protein
VGQSVLSATVQSGVCADGGHPAVGALKGIELAREQMTMIRLKLFKIGAVIIRNTRRIRFLLSSAYPYQALFFQVAALLKPG